MCLARASAKSEPISPLTGISHTGRGAAKPVKVRLFCGASRESAFWMASRSARVFLSVPSGRGSALTACCASVPPSCPSARIRLGRTNCCVSLESAPHRAGTTARCPICPSTMAAFLRVFASSLASSGTISCVLSISAQRTDSRRAARPSSANAARAWAPDSFSIKKACAPLVWAICLAARSCSLAFPSMYCVNNA